MQKNSLLITSNQLEEKQDLVIKIIKKTADEHHPDGPNKQDRYRKSDIIESILKEL